MEDITALLREVRLALLQTSPLLAARIERLMRDVPEVTAMPCISTAHITQSEADALTAGTGWATRISYTNWHDYGFICFVQAQLDAPPAFSALMDWARDHGWEFIRLDQDGETVEQLPTYEW
jgi:hypothetical protein